MRAKEGGQAVWPKQDTGTQGQDGRRSKIDRAGWTEERFWREFLVPPEKTSREGRERWAFE